MVYNRKSQQNKNIQNTGLWELLNVLKVSLSVMKRLIWLWVLRVRLLKKLWLLGFLENFDVNENNASYEW